MPIQSLQLHSTARPKLDGVPYRFASLMDYQSYLLSEYGTFFLKTSRPDRTGK